MPMPDIVNGLPFKAGAWEEYEDDLLATYQLQMGNRWASVAKHIPGRTGQQCAQRWRHRVNPNITKEKWTREEDNNLFALVQRHGNFWAEIARGLKGRTDQQCMGRWRRHLDPSIRRDSWKSVEDAKLTLLFGQYGSQWSRICTHVRGRTAQQCRARWFQINPDEPSASGLSNSPPSRSLLRRARRTGAGKRLAPKFSDSDISEAEGAEGGEPSANSDVEEQSYVPVPPTMTSPRLSRRQVSSRRRSGQLLPLQPLPLQHPEHLCHPRLWQPPQESRPLAPLPQEQAEDDDICEENEGNNGFDTPVKRSDPPRPMASSRSAHASHTGYNLKRSKRRSSIVTTASVEGLPATADTPGASSLSAVTGASPGGLGHRGGLNLSQHPPLFLSPDSFQGPRLPTNLRTMTHLLPAPEEEHRPVLDMNLAPLPELDLNAAPLPELELELEMESAVPAAEIEVEAPMPEVAAVAEDASAEAAVGEDASGEAAVAEDASAEAAVAEDASAEAAVAEAVVTEAAPAESSDACADGRFLQLSPTRFAGSPVSASRDTCLLSPTQDCRTAETLFATPQRLGISCGMRQRQLLNSPLGSGGRFIIGGRSIFEHPLENRNTPAGRSSPMIGALEAMLQSPEQPGDALQAPDSAFRCHVEDLMTPDWVKGRHPKRSVGPFQRASQKGATLSRCEEQELRASRNLASARNSRPSVKRRLLINDEPLGGDANDAGRPGALSKKLYFDGVASNGSTTIQDGGFSAAGKNDDEIVVQHVPAPVSKLTVDDSIGSAITSSSAAKPLLGPWQALDTTLQPLQPFASISTLEAALAYTAALSTMGSIAGINGGRQPVKEESVIGQVPKPVTGALSASSSHVRMRLNAILDNL